MTGEIVLAIIASGFLTKLLDALLDYLRNRKDVSKEALKCLLRNEFLGYYESHKEEKTFGNEDEYNNIEAIYKAYTALKGNSFVIKRWKEMESWKIN